MDIHTLVPDWLQLDEANQKFFMRLGEKLGIFFLLILLSLLAGRYTPVLINLIIQKIFPQKVASIYTNLIEPIENLFKITGTLIFLGFCLDFIKEYQGLYNFAQFFMNLAIISSIGWLASRLFRQFIRTYGIDLIRRIGLEADEFLLVFETIINIIIGFVVIVAFAQSQNVNLVGLLAGVGIGGIAIAFAAQKTLEQLIGTLVLYLDRPFVPGEYIRVNFNPQAEDVFARIESIGLRSTKLRTVAKSTLLIVPNSIMASKDIENISRGKKVMVLLYLDFTKSLENSKQALVEQVVKESTDTLFGIDPGSTKVALFRSQDKPGTRARVTFFILGSSENSLELRKRLLELANTKISQKLTDYGIEFIMQEPIVYVDSPVTI
jgi:small-conductance mechanosensitive channel